MPFSKRGFFKKYMSGKMGFQYFDSSGGGTEKPCRP
jgi:hypothetical protein